MTAGRMTTGRERPSSSSRGRLLEGPGRAGPAMTLLEVLERSRDFGFLGPGPVSTHVDHAMAMAAACESSFPEPPDGRVLDLGSGGGLPGLVLIERWPKASLVLLDSNRRRCGFLSDALRQLGAGSSCIVICERAEVAGRDPALRASVDLVVARSFGLPGVTAECAAPFLKPGGALVVAEPPAGGENIGADRWPREGCALVGLAPEHALQMPTRFQVLRQITPCPDEYPRRVGVPSKRPLFR